jgi:SAM-dependent MidA family methyltransferase
MNHSTALNPLNPSPQQLERSQALLALVANKIASAGGFLPFDDLMRSLLYAPQLGYYSGPSQVFGADGDFITAPKISPIFAACLARQFGLWLDCMADNQPPHQQITEFGAGDGLLAGQLLAQLGKRLTSYQIIELSADLQARQRATIEQLAPQQLSKVVWLGELPEQLNGIVFGNELLDAMPVKLFELQIEQNEVRVLERGVQWAQDQLAWESHPASSELTRAVLGKLAQVSDSIAVEFPSGYCSELALEADGWVSTVAQKIEQGVLLLIDYGFGAREYYLPQRSGGTLMCHYRHRAHSNPLVFAGLQDITSHVDFSSVAQAAVHSGLSLLGYTTQARFLMNNELSAIAGGLIEKCTDIKDRVALTQGLQKLVSEVEMGELFKVIALAKHGSDPFSADGFITGDRSNRL